MSPHARTDLGVRFREYSHYTEVKQLVYSIASLQREKMFHSIAVLSYFHGEGRTLLCIALALAYAEACRSKVLIVDTTLRSSPGSLAIKECLSFSEPRVKSISLTEWRTNQAASALPSSRPITADRSLDVAGPKFLASGADFSMILSVAKRSPDRYGLVVLDTMPLGVRNKNNFDPRLVARLADTSLLVVSQKLLDAPRLTEQLRMVEDPALHLIGTVSNEGFTR